MRDQFAVTLVDHELLNEVEMMTSLMIAATAAEGPMSLDEIDGILDVVLEHSGPKDPPGADPMTRYASSSLSASRRH